LQAALAAQRSAGHGRLGEWLQALGFSSEIQITAALARQWSCPVLRASSSVSVEPRAPQIPLSLLEHLSMIPVNYVESTRTLHLAFSETLDYTALYAIEQMTGCHTEACFATPTLVRTGLAALSPNHGESEICFDNQLENSEISRIIRSYCSRLRAPEIRLARCGSHVWARRSRHSRPPWICSCAPRRTPRQPKVLRPASRYLPCVVVRHRNHTARFSEKDFAGPWRTYALSLWMILP